MKSKAVLPVGRARKRNNDNVDNLPKKFLKHGFQVLAALARDILQNQSGTYTLRRYHQSMPRSDFVRNEHYP